MADEYWLMWNEAELSRVGSLEGSVSCSLALRHYTVIPFYVRLVDADLCIFSFSLFTA